MLKKSKVLVCLALLFSFTVPAIAAQSATATLNGRIVDPQGAVVVGVDVIATNKATGLKRETKTDDEGLFVLTNLAPGDYMVEAKASGFMTTQYNAVALQVGQTLSLDIELKIGKIEEGDLIHHEPMVNSSSPVVDGLIARRSIENLPLNGRNFLELALLVPGNAPAPNFDPTKSNSVTISSAGQLGRGGNITIDGADNNDDVVGGPLQNVSQESVQEFQIATNQYSAEYGRSASSVINVVTKAGSNEFHGSASFFFRDDKIQGLPATFDRNNEKPPFDRQQYAFALGGPIVRDKAFWFGALEYRNQDGASLVGERDTARRIITRNFVPAPLDDFLATGRVDWAATINQQLSLRYAVERLEETDVSTLIRPIGSASQREDGRNRYHSILGNWTSVISPTAVNSLRMSFSNFFNRIDPVVRAPQLTFPSFQDGASFRVPQGTIQKRFQIADTFTLVRGAHTLKFGGEFHRVDARFDLEVFQQGRIELAEDFPAFDRNGDRDVDDDDLLFAVTLRSGKPTEALIIDNADNNYFAGFIQDDWRVRPQLTINLGLRYEIDTDVKNVSRTDELNPLILPFLSGERHRDKNNFGPRVGFNWASASGNTSIHGGYGIYYDRVTLQLQSLERGLDGRALPIEVRAGSIFFINPDTGGFFPGAPVVSNPFTGFILPGAGASGINIIDNRLQNPMVQQMNIGIQQEFGNDFVIRADYLHNLGTHFIIGRTIGAVFNPVVGGPDRVVNLESSVNTQYDGLLMSFEKRFSNRYLLRASYTLSKAFNYANDDQIPFSNGPVDPNNIGLEYGPTPNDQRHRFTFSGVFELPYGFVVAPLWTLASGVPMDILLPDGLSRIPILQRNAGGRIFKTGAELNAFIQQINSGISGDPLPLVRDDARFNDKFNALDLRVSKRFRINENISIEPIAEVFNVFNITNVLGLSNVNYSGFTNALVRDSNDPSSPGFLRSSSFGQPVTTAGGVFGSGGPRAFQFAARFMF